MMSPAQRSWTKWIVVTALVAAASGIGLRSAVNARVDDGGVKQALLTFAAKKGPLTISVPVWGTIKPLDQEILKSEVEGNNTVLYVIPEGEIVEKGDLLVELDGSRLDSQLVDEEIRVFNGEANFIGAKETLAVTKNQAESNVDRATLDYRFAQEDLKNFLEGTYPQDLMTIDARITLARGTVQRTNAALGGSKRLYEKDFITKTELEADEFQALKAELDLELAENDKVLLTDFTYDRRLAELESDVHQSKMALERTKRAASADITQAEANLKSNELEFNRDKEQLEKTRSQLANTKIYAPMAGVVIYATSGKGSANKRGIEPLAEGVSVLERQELIHLPTTSAFMCETAVHESSLSKVRTGLPVRITVDALQGQIFWAKVTFVAPLPDATSAWMNPDLKIYATDIELVGDTNGLHTGMSCRGEIIVEEHEQAIYVPVHSVVREKGKTVVYVMEHGGIAPREVEIGLDNNRMVHITKGLEEGEEVLLAPPLSTGDAADLGQDGVSQGRPEDLTIPDARPPANSFSLPERNPVKDAPVPAKVFQTEVP